MTELVFMERLLTCLDNKSGGMPELRQYLCSRIAALRLGARTMTELERAINAGRTISISLDADCRLHFFSESERETATRMERYFADRVLELKAAENKQTDDLSACLPVRACLSEAARRQVRTQTGNAQADMSPEQLVWKAIRYNARNLDTLEANFQRLSDWTERLCNWCDRRQLRPTFQTQWQFDEAPSFIIPKQETDVEPISAAQCKDIYNYMLAVKADFAGFLKAFKIEDLAKLPVDRYDEAMRMLDIVRITIEGGTTKETANAAESQETN